MNQYFRGDIIKLMYTYVKFLGRFENENIKDIDTTETDVNITLYGLSTVLREDVEFKYENQTKQITHNELKNYNPNNPLEFSFDKIESISDIDVYFDGRHRYTIEI